MRESRRGKWEGPRFESLEERVGEWPRTAGSGHRLAGALPSPRRVCVDGMFKLRGLPCVLIVLSCVGLLAVRSLAPAEAQEVPYLGGAACVQYGECGGGGGTDPGPPLLVSASASASAPASPPSSTVPPDIEEDDGDHPGHGQLKYGAKDEQMVGKDAKQGARDATGALGRAREGQHQGGRYRRDAGSGWLGLAQSFVRPGLWSAGEEDVAAAGTQVARSEPAEATPVTDTAVEGGGEPLKEAAETSDGSAEIDIPEDDSEIQHVREVASVKWVDSDFMESGIDGAGGERDAEPDGEGVENAEAGLSGGTTGGSVAQELRADGGLPDLAVAGLGPVGKITERRHGGATLVAGGGALLVAAAFGTLVIVVRRRRAG
jgi:hypothetical protein